MCRSLIFDVSSLSTQSQPPIIIDDTLVPSARACIQVRIGKGSPASVREGVLRRLAGVLASLWICPSEVGW